MQEVTFTLQTITPLFLAGADQTTAELRAPTFRGLMRYWLRALVGGMAGTDSKGLEDVKQAETDVFGATDAGSAVSVRVSGSEKRLQEYYKQGNKFNITGKDYLLWSMESFRDKPRRLYFPQGTEFQVTLSVRDSNETHLNQAIVAFWLLTHLGGIGSRSRRCAGSLTFKPEEEVKSKVAEEVKSVLDAFNFSEPVDIKALQSQLKQGIELAQRQYGIRPNHVKAAPFDTLAKGSCRIWILHNNGKPWHSPDETMNALGENLQIYRKSIFPIWKRKVFGLPLKGVPGARLASPLLLRVTKLQGEQYVGVAVLFKTDSKDISIGDYSLIENWINNFQGILEVTL